MGIVDNIEGHARIFADVAANAEAAEGRSRPVVKGHDPESVAHDRCVAYPNLDANFPVQSHIIGHR